MREKFASTGGTLKMLLTDALISNMRERLEEGVRYIIRMK